ncbi:hypothetical protein FCH28_30265 [Streptomyces piniterrae]|uniref:Tetracyclin repressor-like C-terminal domain-containing protein n=1 Tax=Streptomyces piniterrae TaxID=2571125 RepID=A0A4U0MV49_9ACTN|nr:hypothetical protein FCH28_30265 [Streptomyces piniterrae]
MKRLYRVWRRRLAGEVRIAADCGDLPSDTDPEQVAYERVGLYMAFNQEIQLFANPAAAERTRRALARLVTTSSTRHLYRLLTGAGSSARPSRYRSSDRGLRPHRPLPSGPEPTVPRTDPAEGD